MEVDMLRKRSAQGSLSPSQAQESSLCRRGLMPAGFHHGIGSLPDHSPSGGRQSKTEAPVFKSLTSPKKHRRPEKPIKKCKWLYTGL